MASNAIFLEAEGTLEIRQVGERYKPTDSQSLVEVKYSAINPGDVRHSYMGLYGSVAGYEFVGKVVEAGPNSAFRTEQKVFGMTMPGSHRPKSSGAHQSYMVAENYMTWPCPSDLEDTSAVTMPAGYQTASDALFNILGYGFSPAKIDGHDASNVPILIWGGASLCGLACIQVAKLAGFSPIITTASEKNHKILQEYGATVCFDYRDPNVVQSIRDYVQQSGQSLTTAFDAVGKGLGVFEPTSDAPQPNISLSSPSLARNCCSDPGSQNLRLCCVLPVAHDPLWKFCIGIRPYGDSVVGFPQDPSYPHRVESFMSWLVPNHRLVKPFPNISIVQGGQESIRQMYRVFDGKVSLEKVVIAHPLDP